MCFWRGALSTFQRINAFRFSLEGEGSIASRSRHRSSLRIALLWAGWVAGVAGAQVNVLTAHNDIARTGQNLGETTLSPANVNPAQFGKLFSWPVNGSIQAQPLYVSGVTIPGKGVHNVVYAATERDIVYAYDADSNGGVSSAPLWSLSLLTNSATAGTYQVQWGVVGTPVIDLPSNTMYLVSSEIQGSLDIFRLHALDIATGVEKLGGPVLIQGALPGTGTASVSGMLTFNPNYQYQRPGLLLLNGIVYIAFGSISDIGAWHGWIFSYSTSTALASVGIYCTSPNGTGDGIWMGGAGLAAEVANRRCPTAECLYPLETAPTPQLPLTMTP